MEGFPLNDPARAAQLAVASGLLQVLAQQGLFSPSSATGPSAGPGVSFGGAPTNVFNFNGPVTVPGAGDQATAERAGAARELARRSIRTDALTA